MVIFKPYSPTPEKLDFIAEKMKTEYLWLSDEYRNDDYIWRYIMPKYSVDFSGREIYEIGDFGGLLIFWGILPDFKCELGMKLWEKMLFTHRNIKETEKFIDSIAVKYQFKRINTVTSDVRVVRLAKMVGFDEEGIRFADCKWDGCLYDTIFMGKEYPSEE